ncbi:MAG TPA: hypothetical protein VHV83_13230 [Armatimonadota bacterium]|nr:hypothetical protein [Armatimonadota bacterium]
MSLILLVSNGEEAGCSEGSLQGTRHLSTRGCWQAEAVARALAHHHFSALYVTDDPCSTEMAFPLASQFGLIPVAPNSLREDQLINGGLTSQQIQHCICQLMACHGGGDAVLCASPAVNRLLLYGFFGLAEAHGQVGDIQQQPGAINRVILDRNRTIVTTVNDLCHLQV